MDETLFLSPIAGVAAALAATAAVFAVRLWAAPHVVRIRMGRRSLLAEVLEAPDISAPRVRRWEWGLDLASVVAAVAAGALFGIVAGALAIAGCVGGQWVGLKLKRRRRRLTIDRQLPDVLGLMSGGLHAGMTLIESIGYAGRHGPEPAATELRVISNQYRGGASLADALHATQGKLKLRHFDIITAALLINRREGGDVVLTLDECAKAIEQLRSMQEQVRSKTTGGRLTVGLLALSPLFFMFMGDTLVPDGLSAFVSHPIGLFASVVAGLLYVIGLAIAVRVAHPKL